MCYCQQSSQGRTTTMPQVCGKMKPTLNELQTEEELTFMVNCVQVNNSRNAEDLLLTLKLSRKSGWDGATPSKRRSAAGRLQYRWGNNQNRNWEILPRCRNLRICHYLSIYQPSDVEHRLRHHLLIKAKLVHNPALIRVGNPDLVYSHPSVSASKFHQRTL